jgi:hypothetical protein
MHENPLRRLITILHYRYRCGAYSKRPISRRLSMLVQRFLGTTPIGYVPQRLRDSELQSTDRVDFTESLY